MKNKYLLICGIIASFLYIGADIFVSTQYPGYSYRDQAISELSAIGAPTKGLWTILLIVFDPLLVAFGLGVRKIAGHNRSLKITGSLLIVWGLLGLLWYLFPMNMRGSIGSTTDTMHLVMSVATVLLILLFVGFGSGVQGKWFRIYSIFTILMMLVFGAMVGQQAPRVAAQLPTPWMGIMERISVYSPMVWVIVLASILFQRNKKTI
jgi:hypothetical membrane protein